MHARNLRHANLLGYFLVGLTVFCAHANAEDGQPVAVRYWPGGGITVETMWNFNIAIRAGAANRALTPTDLDLILTETKSTSGKDSDNTIRHAWSESDKKQFVLDRVPNQSEVTWLPASKANKPTSNAVRISQIQVGDHAVTSIEVDGVRVLDCGAVSAEQLIGMAKDNPDKRSALSGADVLLITNPDEAADKLVALAESLKPRTVVLPLATKIEKVGDAELKSIDHNTLAVCKSKRQSTQWVRLGQTPWKMTPELTKLFADKELASKNSQAEFAKLSVTQMNFKPSNGTHTPRWNPEHMMGVELLFFSQIYNAIDKTIPIMDLRPKQMPKDYQAAHGDWTGTEEARQMQRVQAFTRRFAFYLDGLPLDKQAPGSRFWTPQSLLKQMYRHYSEHTGKMLLKKDLPGWPSE